MVTLNTPDDLIAVVPHLLGYRPAESLVVVPLSFGTVPCSRGDLPITTEDRERALEFWIRPLGHDAPAGTELALICFTENRPAAEEAVAHLAAGLVKAGTRAPVQLITAGGRWEDLRAGQSGTLTREAETLVATEMTVAGRRQPASSWESLVASMDGDPQPVADLLPAASASAEDQAAERSWTMKRIAQFHRDGLRVSDADAARMLTALTVPRCQLQVWTAMSRKNSVSHAALWFDLTRRAPEQVRGGPASLLGFASWLAGEGPIATIALRKIPDRQADLVAGALAVVLTQGVDPRRWDAIQAGAARKTAASNTRRDDGDNRSHVTAPSQVTRPRTARAADPRC